jgi:HPt (histidine-containing phosphotransfer) domain-containing protein
MTHSDSNSVEVAPLVDLEQLQSACDGDDQLLRELMVLYFTQAGEIMAGLGQAIEKGDVAAVDHFSHKLAGSSLACGLSAPVTALRQLEQNAMSGPLQGAPGWFGQVGAQLEAVRHFMEDYLQQHQPR